EGTDAVAVGVGTGVLRTAGAIELKSVAAAEHAEIVVEAVVLHHHDDDVLELRQHVGAFRHLRKRQRVRPPARRAPGRRRCHCRERERCRQRRATTQHVATSQPEPDGLVVDHREVARTALPPASILRDRGNDQRGLRITTGMSRAVPRWYPSYDGHCFTMMGHSRALSLAVAVCARTGITVSRTWISTSGRFARLPYHPGFVGAPPFEATIT